MAEVEHVEGIVVDHEITMVHVDDLKYYEDNPRVGDVEGIAESLAVNGQFRPILANRVDDVILAGNHTHKGMVYLNENGFHDDDLNIHIEPGEREFVATCWVRATPEQAENMVLADNALADAGTYRQDILAKVLSRVPNLKGTGFSQAAAQRVMDAAKENKPIDPSLLRGPEIGNTGAGPKISMPNIPVSKDPDSVHDAVGVKDDTDLDDEDFDNEVEAADVVDEREPKLVGTKKISSLDDVEGDEESMIMLRDDVNFPPGNAIFDIPELSIGMVLDDLPEDLTTWAGRDATPDDGVSHYLYNTGVDSASGLPFDRAYMGFYTHDRHFEPFWEYPSYYVSRMMRVGMLGALTPNFSLFTNGPDALNVFNAYRAKWVGRYMQEVGIKIIPDVQPFRLDEWAIDLSCAGIPVGLPWLSFQGQSISGIGEETDYAEAMKLIIGKLKPKNLLVYGGNPARRIVELLDHTSLGVERIHFLANRAEIRRGAVFDRHKQEEAGVDDFDKMSGDHD
jgi:hypothetical protein